MIIGHPIHQNRIEKKKLTRKSSSLANSQNTFFFWRTQKNLPPNKKKSRETKKPTAAPLCLVSPREKGKKCPLGDEGGLAECPQVAVVDGDFDDIHK